MRPAATRPHASSTLHLAFELGNTEWKLAMTPASDRAPITRVVVARDLAALERELARAKAHFGLPATAGVVSCYEAGRDGFWLHRWLTSRGITNLIVDSSSIEVNRRRRRTKTDRLDARKLVTMLIRYLSGERPVWGVVRVPTVAEEDRRQVHRELLGARRDRGRHVTRVKGLLVSQGVPLEHIRDLLSHLATARRWDGSALSPRLRARLVREWETIGASTARIRALKRERRALLRVSDDPAIAQVRQLHQLVGVGIDGAWLYVMEFFSWRQFRNRRQVGGLAGLTDAHYQSGDEAHQQGISKAGNRWVRAFAINTAWAWLRFSTAECARRLVSRAVRRGHESAAQDRDRRACPKTADRVLAVSRPRHRAGGSRAARLIAASASDWRERPAVEAGLEGSPSVPIVRRVPLPSRVPNSPVADSQSSGVRSLRGRHG